MASGARSRPRRVPSGYPADRPHRSLFFSTYLGACRRRTPRSRADVKVSKDASNRDPSEATLRFDLAPRRSPSACAEKLPRTDPRLRPETWTKNSKFASGDEKKTKKTRAMKISTATWNVPKTFCGPNGTRQRPSSDGATDEQ